MKVDLVGIAPYSLKGAPAHSHNCWEIVLNFQGEGTTVIGDKEYHFYPGTIICQPPNVLHSKTSNNEFKDIFIQVSDFVRPNNEEIPIFIDDEGKSFETLMLLALRIFYKKQTNYVSVINSLYETMYQMLLSWSDNKQKNDHIELFKNEVIKNFTNPEFKISDALNNTSYCNDYFRRCFKKDTGSTPIAYLMNLRLEYAKKLLHQKGEHCMTISEISLLSGFYDSHYFSRVFKNKFGLTPKDYITQKKGFK